MKLPSRSFVLCVIILLTITVFGCECSELENTLESLDKLLQFVLERPTQLIGDIVFGIILARGQIHVLLQHLPKYPDRFLSPLTDRVALLLTLKILEQKCEEIVEQSKPLLPSSSSDSNADIFMTTFLDMTLWEYDRPLVFGAISRSRRQNSRLDVRGLLTMYKYSSFIMGGTPNEEESDGCLGEVMELATVSKPSNVSTQRLDEALVCNVSTECWEMMTKRDEPTGYPLTHRLLYFQTARVVGCRNEPYFSNIDSWSRNLCSKILGDAQTIADMGFPVLLRDLFIEQVVLCGLEGYGEFMESDWHRAILSWQQPDGCYGNMFQDQQEASQMIKRSYRGRRKRSDGQMDYNCTMHITGLAAAAMALNVRTLVDQSRYGQL